jgi:hypothetical protein
VAHPIPLDAAALVTLQNLPGEVDGLVAGFRRLLRNDGGSSVWFDFRAQKTPTHHLRQLTAGNTLEWETAPVSRSRQESMICFVFAGSFGAFNEPVTGGFLLSVNGRDDVAFDLARTDCLWQNSQQTVALLFQMQWSSAEDVAGFFYVGVSSDLVTPGQPCRISVTALGSDSERWFGINPLQNPVELQATQSVDPVGVARTPDAGGLGSQSVLSTPVDDDIARLVKAWPTLSDNARREILSVLDRSR